VAISLEGLPVLVLFLYNLLQAAPPDMSPEEIAMNKPLLSLVNKTLEERDRMADILPMRTEGEEDEDY